MIKNFKWLFLVSLTFIACSEDDEVITYDSTDGLPLTSGTADFSKYVALGDSFAAGFSDNALFIEGQKGAYPNIIAQQFALVGGGAFTTPFMADNIGGLLLGGNVIQGPRLYFNGTAPVPVAGPPTTEVTTPLTGSFNNMGVPGAKSFHLLAPGYGNAAGVAAGTASPYFSRFSSSSTATVLADALSQTPTFFSLWIGGNDVLGYATSGGAASNPITPTATFDAAYNGLASQLAAGGRKGVVANLPYVNTLPFFTTVPTNPIPGLSPTQAGQLNFLFGGINSALAGASLPPRFATIVADDGNPATTERNPLLIIDESLPNISTQITAALTGTLGPTTAAFVGGLYGQARHASNATATRDYILLPAQTVIGTTQSGAPASFSTIGVTYPMQDPTTLTAAEALEIKNATDSYNITIQAAATANGLAFVDATAIMNQLSSTAGITANNFTLTANFVTGGAFSLDGVHPSPRGYALIANKFIEAINAKYGSNLKGVNLGNYRILFPQNPANF
jgi:lysophospholipase L1-like esterase